jgi:cation transport regulator
MPYTTIKDLPPPLQVRLPLHAQHIYLAAFNNAFAEYADRGPEEQEGTAHRIAWAAVKKHIASTANAGSRASRAKQCQPLRPLSQLMKCSTSPIFSGK